MSRRAVRLAGLVVGMAALAISLLPAAPGALAQTPPLDVKIFFRNPPPDGVFDPAAPITIVLQIRSGAETLTTEGFSSQDFRRRLFFTDQNGGIVTNPSEALIHRDARVFYCHSRQRILQRPTAIPVVPVERLPATFFREFVLDNAQQFFPLRPGLYTVNARIPLLTFTPGNPNLIITDCDQFPDQTLVNVGSDAPLGRQTFTIISNSLQFAIRAPTPPTTTVRRSQDPNPAGWNNQDVTLTFTATGGAGVARIFVSTTGAQVGDQIINSSTGTVVINTEGVTTVTFFAEDTLGTREAPQTLTIQLDKTPPVIAGMPAPDCTLWPPNHRMVQVATVTASDALSGLTPDSPQITGTSSEGDPAQDIQINPDGSVFLRAERFGDGPGRLYTLTAVARDLADNTTTATGTCKVPHDQGRGR